ncbi:MAG: peroxide stress protein YaaA [Pseudomonadota bacterium]|nr:peroxide stress protein YaaA [Pseudomonadota bacterium]
MLIVLSPAKTLDYATPPTTELATVPETLTQAAQLIKTLKTLAAQEIGSLMKISDPLAQLNAQRYAAWKKSVDATNAKQAVLAFAGDVYQGLDAPSLSATQLTYLQGHLRILSGLYGALRPLDLLQPYRLEMGTRLATQRGHDLYAFWGNRVTDLLNTVLRTQKAGVLVNLASEEYFGVVQTERLIAPVITPIFQDFKNGRYKVISFYAKRARGLMTRFAATRRIVKAERLREFDLDGYAFAPDASSESEWVFRRRVTS